MTKCVIFAAKSTADEKGSIPQQIAECETHAEAQGWAVALVEQDEAASAWSGNRGAGLERAMAHAEGLAKMDGTAVFLVWNSNRLARGELTNEADARHLIDYFRWADRAGVTLASVSDPGTFTNSIVAFIVGEMNARESAAKSKAVRRAARKKREDGVFAQGDCYGYLPAPGIGLKPNPETAPVVQRIFALIAQGTSQAEVTRILNAEGVPTARNGKAGWVQGTISQMLRCRTYLGEVPTDDPRDRAKRTVPEKWGPGRHEALIAQATWDAAHASNKRKAKRKGKGGGRPAKAGHLIGGHILHHAVCGSAMTPRSGDLKKDGTVSGWYVCSGKKGGICDGLTVPMNAVDQAITDYLASVGLDTEQSLRLLDGSRQARAAAASNALADARRTLAKLEAERARMWVDRRAGNLDPDDWAIFKTEYTDEKSALLSKVERIEAKAEADASAPLLVPAVADALSLVRDFIERGDKAAVRNVVEALFEDFIIGHADDAPEPKFVISAQDARHARDALRARLSTDPALIAEANMTALLENAELPYLEPADDPLVDGISLPKSLLLLPEPRREALASVIDGDGTALLVDENGRNMFRKLPLLTTDVDALQT